MGRVSAVLGFLPIGLPIAEYRISNTTLPTLSIPRAMRSANSPLGTCPAIHGVL